MKITLRELIDISDNNFYFTIIGNEERSYIDNTLSRDQLLIYCDKEENYLKANSIIKFQKISVSNIPSMVILRQSFLYLSL